MEGEEDLLTAVIAVCVFVIGLFGIAALGAIIAILVTEYLV